MKNILKFSTILGILLLFMTSCGSDDAKSSPEITGIESMIQLMQGDSKSFELAGGDGNFSAMSANKEIATVEVKGKKVTITGVAGGKTKVTINAGSKVKVVEVTVEKKEYPEITGIEDMISVIQGESKTFELAGGEGNFTVNSENSGIATAMVNGKSVKITGVAGGKTKITITSGEKTKIVEVNIVSNIAGVYKGGESVFEFSTNVKNNKGMWLVEKAGYPYEGKRIHLSKLPDNLQEGGMVNLNVRAFDVEGVKTGAQDVTVEAISDKVIGLKIGEVLVVIPKM